MFLNRKVSYEFGNKEIVFIKIYSNKTFLQEIVATTHISDFSAMIDISYSYLLKRWRHFQIVMSTVEHF